MPFDQFRVRPIAIIQSRRQKKKDNRSRLEWPHKASRESVFYLESMIRHAIKNLLISGMDSRVGRTFLPKLEQVGRFAHYAFTSILIGPSARPWMNWST